jgi:lysophospholipase L1-like esterase
MRSAQRRLCFTIAAIALGLALPATALLATDIYLHRRFERGVLFNVWGYRGPVVGRKRAGEYRVAVLGGSAAYGFGVTWEESMPAQLERRLVERDPRFRVVNLAYNNEGAYSFTYTLQDYAYLKSDLIVLYEGYNDLMGDPDPRSPNDVPNRSVFRHESPIFRLTGYLPVFPIIFREKASILLYGDTRAAYQLTNGSPKTVFRPGLARRTEAEILQAAVDIDNSLERQLGRIAAEPQRPARSASASECPSPWGEYCSSMRAAITWARAHGEHVLVVTQPYLLGEQTRARHVDQQRALARMVQFRFQQDDGVRYVDLGDAVDLRDPSLSFDRMHLSATGNARIAQALVEPLVRMAATRTR